MSHASDADGSDDEKGGFALGTLFTVSGASLPSLLRHHQHLKVVPFIIAILPNNSLPPHNLARLHPHRRNRSLLVHHRPNRRSRCTKTSKAFPMSKTPVTTSINTMFRAHPSGARSPFGS